MSSTGYQNLDEQSTAYPASSSASSVSYGSIAGQVQDAYTDLRPLPDASVPEMGDEASSDELKVITFTDLKKLTQPESPFGFFTLFSRSCAAYPLGRLLIFLMIVVSAGFSIWAGVDGGSFGIIVATFNCIGLIPAVLGYLDAYLPHMISGNPQTVVRARKLHFVLGLITIPCSGVFSIIIGNSADSSTVQIASMVVNWLLNIILFSFLVRNVYFLYVDLVSIRSMLAQLRRSGGKKVEDSTLLEGAPMERTILDEEFYEPLESFGFFLGWCPFAGLSVLQVTTHRVSITQRDFCYAECPGLNCGSHLYANRWLKDLSGVTQSSQSPISACYNILNWFLIIFSIPAPCWACCNPRRSNLSWYVLPGDTGTLCFTWSSISHPMTPKNSARFREAMAQLTEPWKWTAVHHGVKEV